MTNPNDDPLSRFRLRAPAVRWRALAAVSLAVVDYPDGTPTVEDFNGSPYLTWTQGWNDPDRAQYVLKVRDTLDGISAMATLHAVEPSIAGSRQYPFSWYVFDTNPDPAADIGVLATFSGSIEGEIDPDAFAAGIQSQIELGTVMPTPEDLNTVYAAIAAAPLYIAAAAVGRD